MHELSGYVLHPETGVAMPGVTVTVIDEVTGNPVEVGGVTGGSANPTTTDGNGYFSWTCELSPGPVKVRVTNGGEVKISSGKELRQAGSYYTGDIPVIVQALSSGVINGILEDFLVEAVVGQRKVRVNTGGALMAGVLFSLDTDREYTISANPSLAKRLDVVVLEQWVGTDSYGKQRITILEGTVNNTAPTLNSDPDVLQLLLGTVTVNQNATSVTVADGRSYVGPTALPDDIVGVENLSQDVLDLFQDSVGTGRYKAETNFNSSSLTAYTQVSSSDTSVKTLATAKITVPKGTWLIEATLTVHNGLCTTNSGWARFKLTGNGAPVAPDNTTRPIPFSGNVWRMAQVTSRLVVTPTASTEYTVNGTVQWESGDPVRIYQGVLVVKAY